MGMRYRKRMRMGPLPIYLNVSRSQRGWSHSWSIRAFGVTHNTRSKKNTVDLPGGLYFQTGGKRKAPAKGSAKGSQPRSQVRPDPETPQPYRAARWPYPVILVLLAFGLIGGAIWQSFLLWGVVALVVFGVQQARTRAAAPAAPAEVEPVPEDEDARLDPDEAERIVRDWTPPADYRRAE